MLVHLHIQNFAIIEEAHVDFSKELNVITGETGAGKSLLLDALSMVLGNRQQGKVFFNPTKKCVVELEVLLQEKEYKNFFKTNDLDFETNTLLRREISPSGKSRAFINDTPVKLPILKMLSDSIIDIHSQHENLKLSEGEFQLSLLDSFILSSKNGKTFQTTLKEYQVIYNSYLSTKSEVEEQLILLQAFNQEKDYKTFLLQELDQLDLENLDENKIEEELNVLNNAENIHRIIGGLQEGLNQENGPLFHLNDWKNQLSEIQNVSSQYEDWHNRINGLLIDLEDFRFEITGFNPEFNIDPQHVNELQEKLYESNRLKTKHSCQSIQELLAFYQNLSEEISDSLDLENRIEELKSKLEQLKEQMHQLASDISKDRKQACTALSNKLQEDLSLLGMPNTEIFYEFDDNTNFHSNGLDKVQILFSGNKGFEAKPIGKVASGGELSRLTLAMKAVLAKQKAVKSLIFDEIDTGVSGDIADKIGLKLEKMGKLMQIICISHLPQMAAKGSHHLKVYKLDNAEKTHSKIRLLTAEERITEIAEILSGKNQSETAIAHAKQLLSLN